MDPVCETSVIMCIYLDGGVGAVGRLRDVHREPLGPLGLNSPNIAQRHALHVERTAEKAFLLSDRIPIKCVSELIRCVHATHTATLVTVGDCLNNLR